MFTTHVEFPLPFCSHTSNATPHFTPPHLTPPLCPARLTASVQHQELHSDYWLPGKPADRTHHRTRHTKSTTGSTLRHSNQTYSMRRKVSTPWFVSLTAQTSLVAILEEPPNKAVQSHFSKQIYTSLSLVYNILPLHFLPIVSRESTFSSFRYSGMISL